MSFTLETPEGIGRDIAMRVRLRRLSLDLSQEGLARRAGLSAGTVKRFEKTGQISLSSLLQLALVLGALGEFGQIFKPSVTSPASIDDLINEPPKPQRGRLK